jgi:ligand-binding sensor domain-containing protein
MKIIFYKNIPANIENNIRRFLFFAILFLIPFSLLSSQTSKWKIFNTKNSPLPTNSIHTVEFDLQNNVWIGTWDAGLVKYDFKNWVTYNTKNSDLPDNSIYTILIDKNNQKWVGTFGGGVVLINDEEWKVYNTKNSPLPHDWIYSIVEDSTGNIWFGLWGGQLAEFDGKNWRIFTKENSGLEGDKITSLVVDSKNNLWVGTTAELIKYDGNKWIKGSELGLKPTPEGMYDLRKDYKNRIIIGEKLGGLGILDSNGNYNYYDVNNSDIPVVGMYSIAVDKYGSIWFTKFGKGVVGFNGNTWNVLNSRNSKLPDDKVFSIKIDTQNNKWISTYAGGLAIYNENGISIKKP